MKYIFPFVLCIVMLFSLLPLQPNTTNMSPAELPQETGTPQDSFTSYAPVDYSAYPFGSEFEKASGAVGDNSISESEPNDSLSGAQRVHSDTTVTGSLNSLDLLDTYRFYISQPCEVTIVALAYYPSFAMGVFTSEEECLVSAINGKYTDGYYAYGITGTSYGGTYYLTVLDTNQSINDYSFYILIKPLYSTLETPTLKASIRASDGKIKLSWNEIGGATEYKLYRATSKNGEYKLIKTTTSTSFTNTAVTVGTKYYYKIKAIHSDAAYNSSYCEPVGVCCDLPRPVVVATGITSSGKIKLTWDKIDGAKEYQVYRATSEKGEYTLVKTTSNTSFTNTSAKAGAKYYYKVRAIHSTSAANSAYSTVTSAQAKLAQPTVSSSNIASTGKIKLTWDAVSGAKEYQVYRSTSEKGEYELMMTTTNTSYTNTSAEAGTKYYYKVKAIHSKAGGDSAYSEIESRYCDLEKPTVSISLRNGNPKISWEPIADAKEYKVYRATSKNGEYKLVKTTTSTSFTNTAAIAGNTYYYKVVAISSSTSANSAYSSIVSIKAE